MKQVMIINRKKYATGLFWQPVNPLITPFLYARQLIAKSNKKYNLLTEYKSMIGLADYHDGARAGMVAGASAVMNSFSEFVSFMGVFQVGNNNYYLIAVRNGVIIRDILLDKESEARKMYAELSNMPDWGGLFAPASWGMPRSQEKILSQVIKKDAGSKLRQMSIIKSILPSVIAVVVFLIAGIAFLYSPLFKTKDTPNTAKLNPELAAEYQRQLQAKNEELDKQFKVERKTFEYPYNKLPNPMDRARLCYKAVGFMMQPVMGWNQRSVDCGESHVSAVFSRDFGTLNDFYVVGGDLMPGGIVTQRSENDIDVRVKLPALNTGSSIDERDQETAMRDIVSIFQQANMPAGIKATNETVRTGINRETINIIEITATSKLIPMEFMQIFNGFGGVYMKSVNWEVGGKNWSYKILVYTK